MIEDRSAVKKLNNLRIAIVHEWFVDFSGSERVVEQILNIFPQADLFAVVDFLPESSKGFIKGKSVKTTFIQKLPFVKKKYRNYLPLMPLAVEQFDLSQYDLILSSSHAVSKGVLTGPDQLHISYVHSPIRYAWDLQHQYLKEAGLNKGPKGLLTKLILHYMRLWDLRTAVGVDAFVANSSFISRRIKKVYGRESEVIHPPVDVQAFSLQKEKEDFFLTASRMVPYKRVDLVVEAFSEMPDKHLIVIGDGPDFEKIKAKAGSNVTLMGYQPFEVLRDYMQRAKAFVFAAEEDFGITPVEAQACGTPVIAFGKGGVLDSVRDLDQPRPTGVFFDRQEPESVKNAVKNFEKSGEISPEYCRENSLRFSQEKFRHVFEDFVQKKWEIFIGS